jgi:hypothetical protein
MMLKERRHLIVGHEFAAAGLCFAFSNGYSRPIVEAHRFRAF